EERRCGVGGHAPPAAVAAADDQVEDDRAHALGLADLGGDREPDLGPGEPALGPRDAVEQPLRADARFAKQLSVIADAHARHGPGRARVADVVHRAQHRPVAGGALLRRGARFDTIGRVESSRPDAPFEVYCARCRVSFPVGTRRCVHCGGPTGPSRAPASATARLGTPPAVEDALDPGSEQVDPLVKSRAVSPLTLLWIALAVAAYAMRVCSGH